MLTKEEVLIWGTDPKLLLTGEWAAIGKFVYTYGLLVGISGWGYKKRFCYESYAQALEALLTWNGNGDPPGAWIKEKGGPVERANPKRYVFKGIPIMPEPTIPKVAKRDLIEELLALAQKSR